MEPSDGLTKIPFSSLTALLRVACRQTAIKISNIMNASSRTYREVFLKYVREIPLENFAVFVNNCSWFVDHAKPGLLIKFFELTWAGRLRSPILDSLGISVGVPVYHH